MNVQLSHSNYLTENDEDIPEQAALLSGGGWAGDAGDAEDAGAPL